MNEHAGVVGAASHRAFRTLETSHPPSNDLPLGDGMPSVFRRASGESRRE